MVFSSALFLFRFMPLMFLLYYLAPGIKFKNFILFAGSLVFYAWGEPVYVVLMLFSTVSDYFIANRIESSMEKGMQNRAKGFVCLSVFINLLMLGFFKYADFLTGIVNSVFNTQIPLLNLPLPIGISFYTFQTMSYSIDVYRKDARAQKNIISFGAYVALFPQLIAGPIVRYKTIDKELNNRVHTWQGVREGIIRFTVGLGKKVILANAAGLIFTNISGNNSIPVIDAWIGIIGFAFQIYFDFSGYSDMAIGLGKMMGFHFLENFNYPYESKSITEFFRRWHMSLGTWFREYVYIPLGGKYSHQIRNIMIVWCLTGIWHGAGLNFLVWGLYFGILLIIEKKFLLEKLEKSMVAARIYTLFAVVIGWVIFSFDNFSTGLGYLGNMFSTTFLGEQSVYLLYTNIIFFAVLTVGSTSFPKKTAVKIMEKIKSENIKTLAECVFVAAVLILSVAGIIDSSYNPFLYFRF